MVTVVPLLCGVRRSLGNGLTLWTVGKPREWASLSGKKNKVLRLGIAAGLCEAVLGSGWNAGGSSAPVPSLESRRHVRFQQFV